MDISQKFPKQKDTIHTYASYKINLLQKIIEWTQT